jgi:hypothetical protein
MWQPSQIYKLHGFIPNLCKIYYFIGSYCLNMNVVHYLNTKVMCMTFVTTWIEIQHLCLNNVHNINVQTIQMNEWHLYLFHTNVWKTNFQWKLLPNHDSWTLWWLNFNCHFNGQKDNFQFFFLQLNFQTLKKKFNSSHFIWIKFIKDN